MFIVQKSLIFILLSICFSTSILYGTVLEAQFEKIDRDEAILLSIIKREQNAILKREKEERAIALKKARERLITAKINLSNQRMEVFRGDELLYNWKVSTARRGYRTPLGKYKPLYLVKMHYSRKYHNSPMPHSIFFNGGYAIHGTNSIGRLGKKASHGCVRLHPKNAQKLFTLVLEYGKKNTSIEIIK